MKTSFLLLSAIALLGSCKQTPVSTSEITEIAYGTSFGFCIGYCTKTMVIENNVASKVIESRNEEQPTKSCNIEVPAEELYGKINLEGFRALPDTLGCPDCADGGTEWIQIKTNDGVKRVAFEYQNEPATLTNIISDLREIFDKLGDCEN